MDIYAVKLSTIKKYASLIVLMWCLSATAQDIQWAQYYAAPLYQNPAFAGAEHCDHYIFQQRLQWPGLEANSTSSYASYDRFLFQYRSGVGGYVTSRMQGIALDNEKNYPGADLSKKSIDLTTVKVAAQYAYELPIDATHSVRAGLELGIMNSILSKDFIFPDEIDPVTGYSNTNDNLGGLSKFAPDVAAGFLYYSKHLYAGFSGWHLNNPNLSFDIPQNFAGEGSVSSNIIARKGAMIAGYRINLKSTPTMAYLNNKIQKSLTPTVHYKFQEKSDQLDIGLYGVYDHALYGVWYRGIAMKNNPSKNSEYGHNNESAVFMFGWKFNGWKWSVSYDWVVSTLTAANPRGAYEFSMAYVPCRADKKSKPMKRLPCPVPAM